MDKLYHYKAYVSSVYDGDTITIDIDLGMGVVLKKQKIRLYGINTPEMRGEGKEQGKIVRDLLREKILGKEILIETICDKKGKYGRWLGIVHIDGQNINDWLLTLEGVKSYLP